jgi:hypothetical protein
MLERRRLVRKKSFLRGSITFNNGRAAVDCLIRNISDLGAHVTFSDAVTIPDLVDLYIPQKEQTVRARVLWRHGRDLGMSFPDAEERQSPSTHVGELAARVTHLEAEIATLRRMLKRMKTGAAGDDTEAA